MMVRSCPIDQVEVQLPDQILWVLNLVHLQTAALLVHFPSQNNVDILYMINISQYDMDKEFHDHARHAWENQITRTSLDKNYNHYLEYCKIRKEIFY